MTKSDDGSEWSEKDSRRFLDSGRYFVPERDTQLRTICAVVPETPEAVQVVELCCGEGLLSEALLERFPAATVHAFDGSAAMRRKARERLARFGARFEARAFDLSAGDWRRFAWPLHAVASSLAVHHLDGPGKRRLFADMAAALAPGGVLVVADLVEPTTAEGRDLSARAWDDAVRQQALGAEGDEAVFAAFRAERWNYFADPAPDPVDRPSSLFDQLKWLEAAGLEAADVHWMKAGHAVFAARKPGG